MTKRNASTPEAEVAPTDAEAAPEVPTMTSAEIAAAWGTDSRTLRRFFRRNARVVSPGKGGRYNIPAEVLADLKAEFNSEGSTKVTPILSAEEAATD